MSGLSVPYLTSRQFGQRFGVQPETVTEWVRRGLVIPAGRTPGGRYCFTEAQVEEALRARTGLAMTDRALDIEAHVNAAARARLRVLRDAL